MMRDKITFIKYYPYERARIAPDDCFMKIPSYMVKGLREELHNQRKVAEKRDFVIHDNKEAFLFMDDQDKEIGVWFGDSWARFGKLTEK